jgi:uncharacterized tellurite resistance protein B-like protein
LRQRRPHPKLPGKGTNRPTPQEPKMQDPFASFFATRMTPIKNGEDRRIEAIRIAACALLLELAYADSDFNDAERLHIEAVMRRHFNLDETTAKQIIELADAARENEPDVHRFAALIRDNYDIGQKMLLAEIMWGLVLADGGIARREAYLLRRIANLLDLEAGYLDRARNSAADRVQH